MKLKMPLYVLVIILAIVHLAEAQQEAMKIARIGILPPGPISERVHLWQAFRQGLSELGYVEGKNIVLVFPSGEIKTERFSDLAAELVSLKVDVIVAPTTPALAVMHATSTIPIVIPVAVDPVENRLVASLARPGGNVTGLSSISTDLSGKRLELLKTVVPRVSRVSVLSNPTSKPVPRQMRETMLAAQALRIHLQPLDVRTQDDFDRVFQAAKKDRAGALIVLDDFFVFTHRTQIVKLAAKGQLPAIYGFNEFVEAGGLMSYAANLSDMYRRAATYVDKILKGAKPADLPIEQPTKFELAINLKTAKQIGLTIPQSVLYQADKVIK